MQNVYFYIHATKSVVIFIYPTITAFIAECDFVAFLEELDLVQPRAGSLLPIRRIDGGNFVMTAIRQLLVIAPMLGHKTNNVLGIIMHSAGEGDVSKQQQH